MLIHVLRPQNYIPSPVTSMCSNSSTIAVFRRSGTVEFIDSHSHKKFLYFDFFYEIKQSFFIDLNNIVALSACGKVVVFDIVTLEKNVLDFSATNISVQFHNLNFSELSFYYTNAKNELFMYKNNKSTLVSAIKSAISCFLATNSHVLVGTCDGWIRIFLNGKLETEIEIKSKSTAISMYDLQSFIVTAENGYVYLINPISEIIMDKIQIREHPLTAVAIVNESIHISGVDPRLSCISLSKNKLLKSYQGDPHGNEVNCMIEDNGKLISSGEDCVIVISEVFLDKYTFKKIHDSSMIVAESRDYCLVAGNRQIDLFSVTGKSCNVVEHDNLFNDFITFRVSQNILERINQQHTEFNHFLRFNSTDLIVTAAISFDQKYIAYSTGKETLLYSLLRGSKLCVEKIRTFPPAKKLVFNSTMLFCQGLCKNITIFNLEKFSETSLCYEDFKEEIVATDVALILTFTKQIYNIKDESFTNLLVEGYFAAGYQFYINGKNNGCLIDSVSIITEDENLVVKTVVKDAKVVESKSYSQEKVSDADMKKSLLFRDILYFVGNKVYANEKNLFIVDGKVGTYEIGLLIHGIAMHGENVVVVQHNYKHIAGSFKKCVFKEKYSNK